MYIILLSGESGRRLWPLTNATRSRQFIKMIKRQDGIYESMVQRVYRQIMHVNSEAQIVVATQKSQMSEVRNQLGQDIDMISEPFRRGTFPAIAQAAAYLHDIKNVKEDEAVVVCPIDTFVEDQYYECLRNMYTAAQNGDGKLVIIGIDPTYPSEKYGYIFPKTDDGEHYYFGFVEKPSKESAERYISQGGLWNGGVFAFKLGYMLEKARNILGTDHYEEIHAHYEEMEQKSFDCAVAEKEKDIEVLRYLGYWRDIGTWNTLTETMSDVIVGNGILDETCVNTHLVNELDIPILGMGLKNLVIAVSPNGILVADKLQSSEMTPYLGKIDKEIRYAEKSWGEFRVLSVDHNSLTAQINMKPNATMSYHTHQNRMEIWTISDGKGIVVLDGESKAVQAGDVIRIEPGCKHTIRAISAIKMIEVQLGTDISTYDKIKFDYEIKDFIWEGTERR